MKINELEISNQLKDPKFDITDMKGLFSQHGWEFLGSGVEASVAKHPNKQYVLKVFNTNSHYRLFVKFCEQHKGNLHVPKFNRYVKEIPNTPYSYVRMEELEAISYIRYDEFLSELCVMVHYLQNSRIKFNNWPLVKLFYSFSRLPYKIDDLKNKKILMKLLTTKFDHVPDNSWFTICSDLMKDAKSNGIKYIDLHDDNFMKRGNTLVITDPYYEG
jgi:hypothetical protein